MVGIGGLHGAGEEGPLCREGGLGWGGEEPSDTHRCQARVQVIGGSQSTSLCDQRTSSFNTAFSHSPTEAEHRAKLQNAYAPALNLLGSKIKTLTIRTHFIFSSSVQRCGQALCLANDSVQALDAAGCCPQGHCIRPGELPRTPRDGRWHRSTPGPWPLSWYP